MSMQISLTIVLTHIHFNTLQAPPSILRMFSGILGAWWLALFLSPTDIKSVNTHKKKNVHLPTATVCVCYQQTSLNHLHSFLVKNHFISRSCFSGTRSSNKTFMLQQMYICIWFRLQMSLHAIVCTLHPEQETTTAK